MGDRFQPIRAMHDRLLPVVLFNTTHWIFVELGYVPKPVYFKQN